jgi:hypothetical protein
VLRTHLVVGLVQVVGKDQPGDIIARLFQDGANESLLVGHAITFTPGKFLDPSWMTAANAAFRLSNEALCSAER